MNGPLAQIVALTCHANATLRGQVVPEFFPGNSTCTFCDYVKFIGFKKPLFGKAQEKPIAPNPNGWFEYLKTERIVGIRLNRAPQNVAGISDRMSAGFVGGGGTWSMEAMPSHGKTTIWMARWIVWNQKAPEQRIWRVDYGCVSEGSTWNFEANSLDSVSKRLRTALAEIHAFSEKHNCGGFTGCFASAMETLDTGGAKLHGYHKDLAPEGVLPAAAAVLLDAAQSAWVFGGMGSWNDMGFEGAEQNEYNRVSELLFSAITETIEAATNSSAPI